MACIRNTITIAIKQRCHTIGAVELDLMRGREVVAIDSQVKAIVCVTCIPNIVGKAYLITRGDTRGCNLIIAAAVIGIVGIGIEHYPINWRNIPTSSVGSSRNISSASIIIMIVADIDSIGNSTCRGLYNIDSKLDIACTVGRDTG